jgi:hypothetical protein
VKHLTAVLAATALGLAVAACGSGGGGPSGSSQAQGQGSGAAGGEQATPAGATVADRPGCGQLCQQAGPPAGTDDPGCPGDDSDKCAPCPEGGCADLLSGDAHVRDGIFTVDMACRVDHPCVGALKVYPPDAITDPVAASDISVAPGATATVPIALTTFGSHVVGANGDFEGIVYVFLEGTGIDQLGVGGLAQPKVRLSGTQGELLPCNGEIQVSPNTTCPFAENVFTAYARVGTYLEAKSPATGRSYPMRCYSDAATVYCTGGNDAFVSFPKGGL